METQGFLHKFQCWRLNFGLYEEEIITQKKEIISETSSLDQKRKGYG